MGQKGNICKSDQLSLTQSKQSKQKKSGKCGQLQDNHNLTNDNIAGSDTWCGFQLPLYFHLLFDICFVGFLISEVIVVCGWCCGHYLFDTLNTDRTRAGAHPITSYPLFY